MSPIPGAKTAKLYLDIANKFVDQIEFKCGTGSEWATERPFNVGLRSLTRALTDRGWLRVRGGFRKDDSEIRMVSDRASREILVRPVQFTRSVRSTRRKPTHRAQDFKIRVDKRGKENPGMDLVMICGGETVATVDFVKTVRDALKFL